MGVQLRLSASSSLHVTSLNDVFESPQEVGTCDVVGSHAASDSRVLILTVIWSSDSPIVRQWKVSRHGRAKLSFTGRLAEVVLDSVSPKNNQLYTCLGEDSTDARCVLVQRIGDRCIVSALVTVHKHDQIMTAVSKTVRSPLRAENVIPPAE